MLRIPVPFPLFRDTAEEFSLVVPRTIFTDVGEPVTPATVIFAMGRPSLNEPEILVVRVLL